MRKHQDQVYRVAYRMTGNHDEAQDLAQEAMVEAYRSFHRFQKGTYFDRWVYRIMSHTFIDRLRRRPKVRIESLDEPMEDSQGDSYTREVADWRGNPEQAALTAELIERVQSHLARLPEDYRLAVVLVDIEGLSYEEAAAAMRCPVGTVRSRLHRGRSILAQKLRPYIQNEEDS